MGWRIFAIFMVLFGVIGTGNALISGIHDVLEAVGLLMTPLSALGVYGYAFKKPIFSPRIWTPYTWAFAIWSVFGILIVVPRIWPELMAAPTGSHLAGLILGVLVAAALTFYQWLALWRYAGLRRTEGQRVAAR